MLASDSVINLRCQKRPLLCHPPPAGAAGNNATISLKKLASDADPSLRSLVQQPPSVPCSSPIRRSGTLLVPRISTTSNAVLPIEELRAHAAAASASASASARKDGSSDHDPNKNKAWGTEWAASTTPLSPSVEARAPRLVRGPMEANKNGLLLAPLLQLPTASSKARSRQLLPMSSSRASNKRRQLIDPQPQGTAPPRSRPRRTVRFELERNVVREIFDTSEELADAWMSRHESNQVREKIVECLVAHQLGVFDHDNDSLRGLEVHLNPELMQKKINNCRNYTKVLLDQQHFLKSLMGYCNDSLLSRMSTLLSDEDRHVALDAAARDAQDAAKIHERANAPPLLQEDCDRQGPASNNQSTHSGESTYESKSPHQGKSDLSLLSLAGSCEGNPARNHPVDFRAVQYILLKAQSS